MKILLVAPPFYRLMGSHYNGLHLGIAYIASVLKENGHEVSLYNADYSNNQTYLDQKQLFDSFDSYKLILNDMEHPIWHEIRETIAGFQPDLVGIAMLTANFRAARNIAGIVHGLDRNIKVVVGGAHATLEPEGVLAEKDFDYVVRGEGEFTMLELAEGKPESAIKGLSFKSKGQMVHNEGRPFIKDLDMLPFPHRDSFLNETEYLDLGYIITGRGCAFACAYCASPRLWHRTTRFRSIENVISELEILHRCYNPPLVRFSDDTFTMNQKRAKSICWEIIARKLGIKWVCDTRADCLDDELVELMKESGCVRIKIGVESGSERILKEMQKGLTPATIRRAVGLIKKHNIPLTIYLLAGFPGETDGDLRQTIALAKEIKADYNSLSVLAPYYGTKIWQDLEKSGKKLDKEHWEYFYHQSRDMIVNDGLDPEVLKEFFALSDAGERV